jgi:hypothetical protein
MYSRSARAFRPICGASLGPRRSGLLVSIMRLIGDGSECNFLDKAVVAADVLAIEHRSRGVQKIMGYSKSNP